MAIQKHNTYYDTTKPNSGIYCYDENGNHKEVLTKNDLNAISSISSINDKVNTLSGKTVNEIRSTETVTATRLSASDGTIYYELEAAPEVSDTVIYGENGISAKNQDTKWTIGLSADYLSANALDYLSGNWQNTFTAVTANSAEWNIVSAKVNSDDFIPVKDDVDVLKTNSAHYPVESTNDFITVDSANHKFTLTFNSGDLVTSGWVEERLKDFGGFTTANPGPSGEPAVDEPSTKLIYLVPDITATGIDKYREWIYGTNSAWICIGDTSVDLEPLYELSGKFIDHSVNEDLHIQPGERTKWNEVSAKLNKDDFNSWSAKTESWDITEYSGGFGIDVKDHTISLTENYLSANALDKLSGNWEKASDTLIASSGKWNDTYETVSANSAKWDKVDEKLDTSVFEAYTATADVIPYSGKNGIAIENHEVWISADYLSANALKELSGKWENASRTVSANSAIWNSAYSAIASANLWNGTYERVQASADEWDKVVNKLDKSESAKYMLVDKINKTTDDKISGYNDLGLYYPPVKEYSGKDGIKVEDYFIGIDSGWLDERYQEKGDYLSASEKFLSANALDELSGNWENTYNTVSTNSATWEKVKDLHNVEISSTNSSIGVTATTAVDGTVKYDLSVDEVAVPNISGYNGISARYNEKSNQYEVGFKENDYAYLFGHYGNNSTVTDGTILKLDSNNYYNITIDEDGYITLPQTTNKFTFCINEYIDDNTNQNHEYLLNKLVLSAKNSDSIVASQNYYPSEVGSSNVTLALTIDNSISQKEYCIVYKGSDVAANKLKIEASILEEVTSLDSSRGEVDDYTGREPIRVVQNSRVVELLYDEDVFTLKEDASLGAKKLTIESKGGEVVNKETFDKLLNNINGRMTETIPFGALNTVSDIAGQHQYSYLFRPTIEYDMTKDTQAYMNGGNADSDEYVSVAVYQGVAGNSNLLWETGYTLIPTNGGQVVMDARIDSPSATLTPDSLYYVCVRVDKLGTHGGTWHNVLGLSMGTNTTTDIGNPKPWVGLTNVTNLDYPSTQDFAGGSMSTFGGTKPYVGFRTKDTNN